MGFFFTSSAAKAKKAAELAAAAAPEPEAAEEVAAEEAPPAEEEAPAAEEEAPAAEEPAAEEPAAEEPAAEEPAAEEPATEEPVAEEPAAEEPVAEEEAPPAVEEAAPPAAVEESAPAEGGPYATAVVKNLMSIATVKATMPDNICMEKFDFDYFDSLTAAQQVSLLNCVRTGFENPDSGLGCYAMAPGDYDEFAPFFDAVCQKYHKASPTDVHVCDWDASEVGDNGVLDVTKLGLDELSMRVRVGRNLTSFNLPGAMGKDERVQFEKQMLKAFEKLVDDPEYGGSIYSLTPEFGPDEPNPNLISAEKYQELVDAHVMFKDMDADPYLKSAGIASDWPYGRGCWQSADKQCIIWIGEEDQLRIICLKKGILLNEVFDRLKKMLDTIESIDGMKFATSSKYGFVTSCPSNLGTGMRASVHVKIPKLCADGTDAKAKAVCKPLGLAVRGTGGEHTPIGADGTVDISLSKRLFIKEKDIIAALYNGIKLLMEEEAKA